MIYLQEIRKIAAVIPLFI